MTKYWLFTGPYYYASAALGDLDGVFDSLESAKEAWDGESDWAYIAEIADCDSTENAWFARTGEFEPGWFKSDNNSPSLSQSG